MTYIPNGCPCAVGLEILRTVLGHGDVQSGAKIRALDQFGLCLATRDHEARGSTILVHLEMGWLIPTGCQSLKSSIFTGYLRGGGGIKKKGRELPPSP